MHSSRMRTAHGSSHPWEGRGSASVHTGMYPLGVGLETPPDMGLETPLARPLNFSPGCGPGDPLLQGMLGYHLQCMLGYYPPVNRMTDRHL